MIEKITIGEKELIFRTPDGKFNPNGIQDLTKIYPDDYYGREMGIVTYALRLLYYNQKGLNYSERRFERKNYPDKIKSILANYLEPITIKIEFDKLDQYYNDDKNVCTYRFDIEPETGIICYESLEVPGSFNKSISESLGTDLTLPREYSKLFSSLCLVAPNFLETEIGDVDKDPISNTEDIRGKKFLEKLNIYFPNDSSDVEFESRGSGYRFLYSYLPYLLDPFQFNLFVWPGPAFSNPLHPILTRAMLKEHKFVITNFPTMDI